MAGMLLGLEFGYCEPVMQLRMLLLSQLPEGFVVGLVAAPQ